MAPSVGPSVIAVPDGGGECGLIAGWTLKGPVDHAALSAAWLAAGLSDKFIPDPPTAEKALGRAVKAAAGDAVTLTKMPGTAWAIEDLRFDSETGLPVRSTRLVARLVDARSLKVLGSDGVSADISRDARAIEARFASASRELDHGAISTLLTRLVRSVDGVAVLRDGGGVYYVPQNHTEEWRAFVAVLRTVSRHFVGEIPALRSDAAIATVLEGLAQEALQAAEKLQAELQAVVDGAEGAIGERALSARMRVLEALYAKLDRYAAIFQAPAEEAYNFVSRSKRNLRMAIEFAAAKEQGVETDAPRFLAIDEGAADFAAAADAGADLDAAAARFAAAETDGAIEPATLAPLARIAAERSFLPGSAETALANIGLAIDVAISLQSGRGILDVSERAPLPPLEEEEPVRRLAFD